MNFSVHFDDATVERLAAAVERTGLTRNRVIGQAVREWLDRNEEPGWPTLLLEHFRNPAPELAQDALDAAAWRAVLTPHQPAQW